MTNSVRTLSTVGTYFNSICSCTLEHKNYDENHHRKLNGMTSEKFILSYLVMLHFLFVAKVDM